MQGNYLITTDNWFYAPDGLKYRAAWGNVQIKSDETLGLITNKNSTNWYAIVGDNNKEIVIAGCQIHYAVKCRNKPNTNKVKEATYSDKGLTVYERPTEIYIAE